MKDEIRSKLELLDCYIEDHQKIEVLTYLVKEVLTEIEILKRKDLKYKQVNYDF